MADDGQASREASNGSKILRHAPICAKLIQIVLAVFAVGLIVDPLNWFQRTFNKPRFKMDDAAMIYITLGGFLIINTLFVVSHVLGDRLPKRTMVLFASTGALLHLVAASLLVHNWRKISGPFYHVQNNEIYPSKMYMDMLISAAVFTFVNAAVFIVEVCLTIKYSTKSTH